MLGLFVVGLVAVGVQSAPVVGPNYDNIQYLHNFTLTYGNNTLEGLGAIDNFTDVNSQMAQSLKSAINLALPGYLASSRTSSTPSSSSSMSSGVSSGTSSGAQGQQMASGSSTPMPMATSTTNMPGRKKRQAMTSTTTTSPMSMATGGSMGTQGSMTTTTPSSSQPSTTQPYGTDEEFYARTDLVHFHVDINDLEGSGAI